jgi:pyruvate kinase
MSTRACARFGTSACIARHRALYIPAPRAFLQDVHEARALLNGLNLKHCKLIAKLDAKSSLANFRGILNAADGIMLSRGNLGLDCLPERVAVIQKNVTTSCNLIGKPCIVTRIVDTMVTAPRPTRAEATDVANAVLDGADCLMLGAETLRGIDPPNAVRTVVSCCHAAEAEFQHSAHFDYLMREAMKAEAGGIEVPGGSEHDGESPASSAHGSNAALQSMAGAGAHGKGPEPSASSASLTRTLHAMTRGDSSHNSTISAPSGCC